MHSISPYSIRCFNPNSSAKNIEDRYAILDKVGSFDTFDVIHAYLAAQDDTFKILEKEKQVYRFFGMKFVKARRQIVGWFEAGSYGFKNDIIDIKTGKVDYQKTQENAEIVRHYIRFYIPCGFNEGVALLHSFKGNGIKTILHDVLRAHFNKITNLNLQMNPLAYKKAFQSWQEASAKELKLTKFSGMKDVTDQLARLGHKEQQLIIKAPNRGALGKLKDYFDPSTKEHSVVEFLTPLCASVKATVDLNGKKRTFTIGRPADDQICEILIDEEDVLFIAGNPDGNSLHKWCGGILQELVDSLYPGMKVKV